MVMTMMMMMMLLPLPRIETLGRCPSSEGLGTDNRN